MNFLKVFTNKGEQKITIPQRWEDLTVNQYQRINTEWDGIDILSLFSIFSGIEKKKLSGIIDPDLELRLFEAIKFIYETKPKFSDAKLPKEVTIGKQTVTIPKSVGGLSIGQSIHVRMRLDGCKTYDEALSFVTAMYLQPFIDDTDFDYHRALEVETMILQMPIEVVHPIGFFLLKPIMKHGNRIGKGASLMSRIWSGLSTTSENLMLKLRNLKGLMTKSTEA